MGSEKGLGQWLQLAGAVVGAVGGIVAIFTFTGFIITLSFVNKLGLYGIPKFAEEFFKEAGVQFFSDFVVVLGINWWHFPLFVFLFIFLLFLAITARKKIISHSKDHESSKDSKLKGFYSFVKENNAIFIFLLIMLVITCLILQLDDIFKGNNELMKSLFFLLAIPGLTTLGIYLILHVAEIADPREWRKNAYGAFLMLFIVLLVCVPLEYGRYIYDVPVYFIQRFECDSSYPSDSLKEFSKVVNEKGTGKVYYLMGHTSGKEVFFHAEEPPAELVLFNSEAVKFLNVAWGVQESPMTLRSILKKVEGKGGKLGGQRVDSNDPKILQELTK